MQTPQNAPPVSLHRDVSNPGACPLDCPPWSALTTHNKTLAEGGLLALRYLPDVAPFGALAERTAECFDALVPLLPKSGRVALQTFDSFIPPPSFEVDMQAPILQMILERPISAGDSVDTPHVELGLADLPDMLDIVGRTRPGPFGPRTLELGRYIGIRYNGTLAAMVGERMRFSNFVEISAVCVDPAFRGHGHAAQLIRNLAAGLQSDGRTPFLHVFENNAGAIALYQKLGFAIRRGFFPDFPDDIVFSCTPAPNQL